VSGLAHIITLVPLTHPLVNAARVFKARAFPYKLGSRISIVNFSSLVARTTCPEITSLNLFVLIILLINSAQLNANAWLLYQLAASLISICNSSGRNFHFLLNRDSLVFLPIFSHPCVVTFTTIGTIKSPCWCLTSRARNYWA